MDFRSLVHSLKNQYKLKTMNDVKDSVATVSTIAGGGLAVMGINEWLTFALLITGIVLNIVRIRAINKEKKK